MIDGISLTRREGSNPSVVDHNNGRPNVCSWLCERMKRAAAWCFSSNRSPSIGAHELSVSLLSAETPPVVMAPFSKRLGGALVLSGCGITASSALLAPVVNQIASRCFQAEIASQSEFNACNSPYKTQVAVYSSILAASSCLMGYILQKLCEKKSDEEMGEEPFTRWVQAKDKFALIQDRYPYEILIGWFYLYNGVSINVSDPSTFRDFLNCGFAGIGLGSALVGMYARRQWTDFAKKGWLRNEGESVDRPAFWKIGGVTICSTTVVILTFIPGVFPTAKSAGIVRDLGVMILCRPLGYAAARFIDRNKEDSYRGLRGKVTFGLSAGLNLRSPLILAGYCIYLVPGSLASELVGMSAIGFVQGVNDFRYKASAETAPSPPHGGNRMLQAIKEYWPTVGLVIFASTLEKFRFLDCQGPPTPLNYTCPLGLELSGYLFPNQLVVESRGVNIVIIAGVAHYYVRRAFRKIQDQPTVAQKIARSYLQVTDRVQFDLLSVLPFALLQSRDGRYEDFYIQNPIVPLVLLGFTFGTHKEATDAIHSS